MPQAEWDAIWPTAALRRHGSATAAHASATTPGRLVQPNSHPQSSQPCLRCLPCSPAQINYPSAEAALAGKGGTVGQLIFSFKTEDIKKGQLEATVQTLADVAGERQGGTVAGASRGFGMCMRTAWSGTDAFCGGWKRSCTAACGSCALLEDVLLSHVWPPASAAADEMTRKGWEAGPENDI